MSIHTLRILNSKRSLNNIVEACFHGYSVQEIMCSVDIHKWTNLVFDAHQIHLKLQGAIRECKCKA
jgi:hypothetical protein